jgi:hypothetical protein
VLEGKHVQPFRSDLTGCRYELVEQRGVSMRVPRRARLAYRDIASATNRRTVLSSDAQHVLCAILNSFVANYLIRLRVGTHVTVALVSRLPVPALHETDPVFLRLARLSRRLAESHAPVESMGEYAELQAPVARLYGLNQADFEHILGTFPLIPTEVKEATLREFHRLQ